MKKIVYFIAAVCVSVLFASCDKEEPGGTATENTAGDWYVTADAIDDNGDVVIPDFNDGRFHVLTYNTAANTPTEMIVEDQGNFWNFKVRVAVDQNARSFFTTTTENNNMVADYEDINVTITDGKILPKAGKQNNGSPADSIVFYVTFSDDTYAATNGYTKIKVSGVRYSGLVENE